MKVGPYITSLALAGGLCLTSGCSAKKELADPPVRVYVETAKRTIDEASFKYSGTIEASETTPLSFPVTGTVARVLVSEGDLVKKGQLLVELNDATLRSAFDMAQASLQRAQDAYQRLKPMHDKGSLPEIKFVEVETGLQQAKAAAAIAKKNLDDAKLYAPTPGYVGARSVDPGMNVVPGLTAIELLNIDNLYARVAISEKEIAHITKGQPAVAMVGALGDRTVQGVIHEIGVQADPIAHTYKIKALLPNPNHDIKPGMICDLTISSRDTAATVVVANQAVRVDERGRTFVFSVDDSRRKATRLFVQSGRLLNDGIEILGGLREGQLVVIAGQQKLVDGSAVEIVN
ncbi:MAG: efflux RND transporter periplasmic adaptor subunit [candidate division Zixibacteria bacterium]|nr:efflux RND transporter periplasmic adaptor subunit [candidate division Zixibacteria bacterium]